MQNGGIFNNSKQVLMIKISILFYFRVNINRCNPCAREVQSPRKRHSPTSSFYDTIIRKIRQMGDTVSRSTRENYLTALRSLCRFAGSNLCVDDIDHALLRRYERWLHDRGISRNTSSCYMRSLRALLGKASNINSESLFKGIFTGRCTTEKRSVNEKTVSQLKKTQLPPDSPLALVRDLFLFSFYAQGMPFVDMAFLKRQQISGGQLVYHRHKTGTRITVSMLPCIQQILKRYESSSSNYVFPLLRSTDVQTAYNEYLVKLNWYNRSLKQLARFAGIDGRLTSYTARHSWATTAYHSNVDLPVISKALGHSNPQTTLTYLREVDDHRLEEANRRIAHSI